MDPNSLAIIRNHFPERGMLNIDPLARIYQSNRLVERTIRTVKHTLKKARLANDDLYL